MSKKQIFVACPIGSDKSEARKRSNKLLDFIIQPVAKLLECEVIRVDKVGTTGRISTQITRYLVDSDIVIIDLTDLNANVMYEFGLRYGTGKHFILMAQKEQSLPFDIADLRTIFYGFDVEESDSAKKQLTTQIETILNGESSVIEDAIIKHHQDNSKTPDNYNEKLLSTLVDSNSNLMGRIEENTNVLNVLVQIILELRDNQNTERNSEMGMQLMTTLFQQGIQNPDGLEKMMKLFQTMQPDNNSQNLTNQLQSE